MSSLDDAIASYADFCERIGAIYQQPNNGLSFYVKCACPFWLLANTRGLLARVDARSLKIHGDNP